jgi:hypothetical protein
VFVPELTRKEHFLDP